MFKESDGLKHLYNRLESYKNDEYLRNVNSQMALCAGLGMKQTESSNYSAQWLDTKHKNIYEGLSKARRAHISANYPDIQGMLLNPNSVVI